MIPDNSLKKLRKNRSLVYWKLLDRNTKAGGSFDIQYFYLQWLNDELEFIDRTIHRHEAYPLKLPGRAAIWYEYRNLIEKKIKNWKYKLKNTNHDHPQHPTRQPGVV